MFLSLSLSLRQSRINSRLVWSGLSLSPPLSLSLSLSVCSSTSLSRSTPLLCDKVGSCLSVCNELLVNVCEAPFSVHSQAALTRLTFSPVHTHRPQVESSYL